MARYGYNTFLVVDCKSRKILLVTSSARKAHGMLQVGRRIEVWGCNQLVEKIHAKEKEPFPMKPYIDAERAYIGEKQKRAEEKNKRRRLDGKRTEFASK